MTSLMFRMLAEQPSPKRPGGPDRRYVASK